MIKNILTAMSVAASISLQASAFEVDLNRSEALQRVGEFTVGQLAVGQKGFVYTHALCYENGRLYAQDWRLLSDPFDAYIQLVRLPSGNFAASFQRNQTGPVNFSVFSPCYERSDTRWEKWPVESVNGFTRYSEWLDYMKSTYEFEQ